MPHHGHRPRDHPLHKIQNPAKCEEIKEVRCFFNYPSNHNCIEIQMLSPLCCINSLRCSSNSSSLNPSAQFLECINTLRFSWNMISCRLMVVAGISKTKPRMSHLINVKEPHFFILRLKTMGVAVAKWCKFPFSLQLMRSCSYNK